MGETTFADSLKGVQERIWATPAAAIGNKIREARKGYGSHDALAQAIGGTSRQHLIKLEQGKHRPRAEMLVAISKTTGKPLDFFLNDAPFPGGE